MESRLGLVFHLGEVIACGRIEPEHAKKTLEREGLNAIARHHDVTYADGHLDHLGGMPATFGFVGVQQPFAEMAQSNRRDFPCQIIRVSDPAVHALAREWRHEMRGIAGEEEILPARHRSAIRA